MAALLSSSSTFLLAGFTTALLLFIAALCLLHSLGRLQTFDPASCNFDIKKIDTQILHHWENLQEEKLMNDRSAFNDKYYKWKHNCYRITCTESSIVVMLFCPVVLRCLLFMNKTVDARKVVITLHTQKK
jgi:hypothetical protein